MTDDRPRLLTERCPTCVLRPHNPMRLGPGRLAGLIAANRAAGTLLICHDTLPYGPHAEVGEAMCRGYFDAYAAESQVGQVMSRLFGPDWFCEVPPPGPPPA